MINQSLTDIGNVLKKYESFAIFSHANADGDAFGSILGLGMSLKHLGKKVSYFLPEPVPKAFAFLKDYDLINKARINGTDVGILLDASDIGRINEFGKHFNTFPVTINIDHHITNSRFATYNYIDENAASTTSIVLELIEKANLPIDKDISNALYTGLITDTGSFHYANVNEDAFLTAAKLVKCGVEPAYIAREIFEEDTPAHLKLAGIALERITIKGKIVFSYISLKDMNEFNATEEDTEGIVDLIRKYKGADVAILFKEVKENEVRVSLRSKEKNISVKEVAIMFGGGGHNAAAGCTVHTSLYEAIKNVITAVQGKVYGI